MFNILQTQNDRQVHFLLYYIVPACSTEIGTWWNENKNENVCSSKKVQANFRMMRLLFCYTEEAKDFAEYGYKLQISRAIYFLLQVCGLQHSNTCFNIASMHPLCSIPRNNIFVVT